MTERSDVLVVGGGVIGACVTQALAARGAAVTLLERESEVCPAASAVYANCGLLVPSEAEPLAHPGALGQGLRWLLDGSSPFYVKPRASLTLARWLWLFRGACAPEAAQAHAPLLHELGRGRPAPPCTTSSPAATTETRGRRGATTATAGCSSTRPPPGWRPPTRRRPRRAPSA